MLTTILSLCALTATITTSTAMQVPLTQNEIICDFGGNEYPLLEGDNSYEIYDSNGVFIEGSNKSNSPYYSFDGIKYYLGPSNYFIDNGSTVTNIFTNEVSEKSLYNGVSYNLTPIVQTRSSEPTPDSSKTYTDSSGYTVVNRADYFRNLKNFPNNWFGECGLVALSSLLSYYDTFYNDDFIPNDKYYDAKYYTRKSRSGESEIYDFDHYESQSLAKNVSVPYQNGSYYDFQNWNAMPGTNYAMRDYLFDKYMHTFMGLGSDKDGYPMFDGELYNTLKDYMEENCNNLLKNTEFRYGNIFYTHQRPKEYISEGLPTLLVLKSYETPTQSGSDHVVLAYGYKDDKFLTHFGWRPGSTQYTEVILNSATIYGYFTIKFNGEHKHSSNVSMTNGATTKYICGCGQIHEAVYTMNPADWGFDERYYFSNEGIKNKNININELSINTNRLRCGYIEEEYINLSPNRYNAGDSYLELTFDEPIYKLDSNLSFWGPNEQMFSNQGDYFYVQYINESNSLVSSENLLDVLSTNRNSQSNLSFSFPNGTTYIKFVAHKNIPNTSSNKGRISIGETRFTTHNIG